MPIEIRELVIKADVSSAEAGGSSKPEGGSVNKDEIIQDVVDKVLDVLNNKNER